MIKDKTNKEAIEDIRNRYKAYKVADVAVSLYTHGIDEDTASYIMEGGEEIAMRPYSKLQKWLSGAMDRMSERIPSDIAIGIRKDSACCLGGVRDKLCRDICKNNDSIDSRFEALCQEKRIIGGKGWRENDNFFITFWYAKPEKGYTCSCLKCIPSEPMNKLWCACCAGHILHHFETALGVKAKCECIVSALSSCGEEACLFRFNIL